MIDAAARCLAASQAGRGRGNGGIATMIPQVPSTDTSSSSPVPGIGPSALAKHAGPGAQFMTPDAGRQHQHASSGITTSSTEPVRRRSAATEDIPSGDHVPAATGGSTGLSSSEGGASAAAPCILAEFSAASTESEQDWGRQQVQLYSSAPTPLRLWRTTASSNALQVTSVTSLLTADVTEEEATASPRGAPEAAGPSGRAADSQPQQGEAQTLPPSSKTRSMIAAVNVRTAGLHNSIASPRTSAVVPVEPMQSLLAYLAAEVRAVDMVPVGDVLWGQTERDRVYNFLLYVPYQLERLIQFGLLLCVDSFLGVMTLLPIRCLLALRQLLLAVRDSSRRQPGKALGLGGGQVFDLLCLLILLSVTVFLRTVRPGWLYYWLKDITNEFLKMSVLSTAFEIADKILGNFGIKVMEALSGTCTLWALGRLKLHHLLCDTFVAFIIVLLHAMVLMCQGLVLAVALNSNRNGLLALLIASYFAEIKSVVFKRWDVERIRNLAWMDVVERFHLVCILMFVLVEDMANSATWAPSGVILRESIGILGAEAVIDIVKHAVLGKFNDVRPGIYREYMKDLCDKVVTSQSHNMHKLLDFHHLACSALFLRSMVTLFWIRMDDVAYRQVLMRGLLVLACWLLAVVLKTSFGYAIKLLTHHYVIFHNQHASKPFLRAAPGKKRAMEALGRKEQGHHKDE